MALTIALPLDPDAQVEGARRYSVANVTFDSSYPTGGEAITAAQLGLNSVAFAICNVKAVGGTVNVANVYYNRATAKLMVFDETPAQVASAADLSSLEVQVVAFGT